MRKILLILLILIPAIFFRFYQLPDRAPFLADQGRDLLEIREAVLDHRLPLVGPPTSQNFKTGPIHYYFLLPSLVLAKFNPLGPIIFSTFQGVLVTWLLFELGQRLFGLKPALIGTLAHATSPLMVQKTLGIWNPIDIPFLMILILICLYQIQVQKRILWLAALGGLLGLAVQVHPSCLIVLGLVFGWWIYLMAKKTTNKNQALSKILILKWSVVGGLVLVITLIPFLVYQFQNHFQAFKILIAFGLEKMLGINPQIAPPPKNFLATFFNFFSLQFRPILDLPFAGTIGAMIVLTPIIFRKKTAKTAWFWQRFFSFWLLTSLFIFSIPTGVIFPHYASFLWVLPFILLMAFLKSIPYPKLMLALGTSLIIFNLISFPKKITATHDLTRTEIITDSIQRKISSLSKSTTQGFNILLLSSQSPSDAHFRYFLKLKGANIKSLKQGKAPYLFLICTQNNCPSSELVKTVEVVESECLPWCPAYQEQIVFKMKDWHYVSQEKAFGAYIYLFKSPAPLAKKIPSPKNPIINPNLIWGTGIFQ